MDKIVFLDHRNGFKINVRLSDLVANYFTHNKYTPNDLAIAAEALHGSYQSVGNHRIFKHMLFQGKFASGYNGKHQVVLRDFDTVTLLTICDNNEVLIHYHGAERGANASTGNFIERLTYMNKAKHAMKKKATEI